MLNGFKQKVIRDYLMASKKKKPLKRNQIINTAID